MRRHLNPLLAGLVASAILIPAAIAAQNPAQTPAPVIRANVRQVLVPVVVTDSKGHNVTDLKESDFKVFEDGVPEKLVAFSTDVASIVSGSNAAAETAVGIRPEQPAAASAVSGGAVRQTYLICIDTLHSSFSNFNRTREALERVLKQEQSPDSQYALMTLGQRLHVIQDSTQDASLVEAAVRSKNFQKMIADSEASGTARAIEQFTALMRSYCAVCMCESNNGSVEVGECSSYKARVQAFLLSFGERMYGLNQSFLAQLSELVRATSSMPTTRTIIFISDGFNRFPGRELYGILQGFGPKDRSFKFNPRDTQPQLENIIRLATRYDVRFYTVDSRGVYSAAFAPGNTFDAGTNFSTTTPMDSRNTPSETTAATEAVDRRATIAARENTDILAELANQTGGLFFENNNDLSRGVRKALVDGREYYVLAYVSKNDVLDGKYRKIAVEVMNGKKKLQVTAKAGYWATKD